MWSGWSGVGVGGWGQRPAGVRGHAAAAVAASLSHVNRSRAWARAGRAGQLAPRSGSGWPTLHHSPEHSTIHSLTSLSKSSQAQNRSLSSRLCKTPAPQPSTTWFLSSPRLPHPRVRLPPACALPLLPLVLAPAACPEPSPAAAAAAAAAFATAALSRCSSTVESLPPLKLKAMRSSL